MTQAVLNYLQVCLGLFAETSEKLYETPFNLSAIERSVRHLRNRDFLTYSDLKRFTAGEHWWFEKFWTFPPKDRLTPALLKVSFNFRRLPDENERRTVENLLKVFKSIELVSILLRFVRPEHYGIISPPVERMLDVRRGNDAAETYLNYIKDLRNIQHNYRLKRVADADMALWVLHEKCFGRYRDPRIKAMYEGDPFMLSLRARNLVAPLSKLSYPKLAQALKAHDPQLASLVGCYAFELLIRDFAKMKGVASEGKLSDVIVTLCKKGLISGARRTHWIDLKKIRDGLFHDGQEPMPTEIEGLINEVVRLDESQRTSKV